jgi:hypothetical protein
LQGVVVNKIAFESQETGQLEDTRASDAATPGEPWRSLHRELLRRVMRREGEIEAHVRENAELRQEVARLSS